MLLLLFILEKYSIRDKTSYHSPVKHVGVMYSLCLPPINEAYQANKLYFFSMTQCSYPEFST